MIQFEPSSRCISPFFSQFKKSYLNLLFLTKHHMEKVKIRIVKNSNEILISKTPAVINPINYFSQKCFCFCFLSRRKRHNFQISMKFDIKKWNIYFQSLISCLFDELYFWPIFYMIRPEFIFQDLFLYCTKKVPKNHNKFWYFRHGGETHFLVLAQTLIYSSY